MAVLTFSMWLLSAAALLAVFWVYVPARFRVFETLEMDLPALTVLCLKIGREMRTTVGMAVVASAVLLGVLPFLLGAGGPRAAKAYGALAVVTLLATAGCWYSVWQPISDLQQRLPAAESPAAR